MKLKLTKLIILAFAALSISIFAITLPTYAANESSNICSSNVPDSVKAAANCNASGDLKAVIRNILNSIIGVSSLVAVIFVIIGGVGYMTSSGDPGKVKKAKDTILYACIGLIICALSFAIVNFTISLLTSPSDFKDQTSCEKANYTWDKTNQKCT